MARKNSRSRGRKPAAAKRPRLRLALRILGILCIVGLAAGAAGLAYLWPRCSGADCPSVAALREYTPPQASRIFDGRRQLVAHLAPERRIVVPLDRIPAHVSGAFLAVEDKRFYRHHGVDYRRFFGAVARNVKDLSWSQGFSTVTMQLARNVFPQHLKREKTIKRKAWEVVLARDIEDAFSKDQILEMYLNQIYLGGGMHGVEAAAQGYFGKSATRLTNAQAATLATIPRNPSHYDPRRNPAGVLARRNLVLGMMASSGVITAEEAEEAKAEPLGLAPPAEARGRAPYFVAAVRRELRERFGADADQMGLRVYTSLDPELQRNAEQALVAQIRAVERGTHGRFRGTSCAGGAVSNPDRCLQGMFVALDADDGDVLALVGGRDYALSQFDRVTQAKRQAGSAFKPIVYSAALARGIPITEPLIGPGVSGGAADSLGYYPADHVSDTVTMDMRGALRTSSNRAAVVLGTRVGATNVVAQARELGITTPVKAYPSTFLGAADVIPIELVAAYAPFANGGAAVKPRLIRRVEDANGRVLYEARRERRYVMSPSVAFLTTSLMRDVVDHGTGSGVRQAGLPYSIPAAGKTGTTNEAADVWFVGATPDVVAGVWLGFDRPQRILSNASGGGLAAPVWGKVMAGYYQSHTAPAGWNPPAGLLEVNVDRHTGKLATAACPGSDVRTEYFIPGSEPTEYCPVHPEGAGGWFDRTLRGIGDWLGGGSTEPVPPPPPRKPKQPRSTYPETH
ncbi:PBP1A family penicillin-binding protein [Longimicrobium sp.]|uniref:penicillin-binding protein 1A n=1 Tax=Longimicrobium sp. TaxID=2029185 RepID=UPI002E356575|nr:PBP1A family penicillin-binding protein [Longimicrobium sp.]HEX6042375.1 PBP1A family penicillin-binding protein [Longimicrobium sp.]